MSTSRFMNSLPGGNFTMLFGPQSSTANTGGSIPSPQWSPGFFLSGDRMGEWCFCTLVLGSTTSLTDGQAYVIDKDFTATLLTTTNSPRGLSVGIGRVIQANVAAGTYFLWLQVNGHCPTAYTGVGNALAETTATGGLMNFTNTSTSTTKRIVGAYMVATNQTFTGDISTAAPLLINNVSSLVDVAIGASLAGTGVGASAKVVSFGVVNGVNQITVDVASTATTAALTITQTGVYTSNLTRPYIDLTNP